MSQIPCVFSFFAGAGFLDLGFESNGFNIVYVNEIFPPFIHAYQHARQFLNLRLPEYGYHTREEGDITQLLIGQSAIQFQDLLRDCRKYADVIGFIGGPPCPDFSIGGKNRGQEGENGKLSSAYIELICRYKPDFFLFENVKGLYKTKKHHLFFESLKQQLMRSDYVLSERLVNAIEYGVPQDRERIILIGFHKDIIESLEVNLDQRIRLSEDLLPWKERILYSKNIVFAYPWSQTSPFEENSVLPCPQGIPQELTVEYWFRRNDVSNHPNADCYFRPRAGLKRFITIDEGDDSKKSFKRLHRWRYSPTACYGNNEVHLHPYKIRRISVAEALAIQSLPKDFVLPSNLSLTNMFKTIGNGVPYLASKAIAQTILDFLQIKKCI